MLILDQAIRHMRHATARGENAAFDWVHVLNEAGESFVNARRWEFLQNQNARVSLTADQDYAFMPHNVAAVLGIEPTNGLVNWSEPSTTAEMLEIRTNAAEPAVLGHYWTDGYRNDEDGFPRPVIEVYPTPTSDRPDFFTVAYHAGWAPIAPTARLGYRILIPAWAEPAFIQWIRAYALGLEEERGANVQARLADVRASILWLDTERRDAALVPSLGLDDYGAIGEQRRFYRRGSYIIGSGIPIAPPGGGP